MRQYCLWVLIVATYAGNEQSASAASGSAPTKPNILFLFSDQHNARCLGVAGHPDVKTPNLDSLAQEGVRMTRAFCQNPICTPSRDISAPRIVTPDQSLLDPGAKS